MSIRYLLPVAALVALAPVSSHAAGTDFIGSVTVKMNIRLDVPVGSSQTVYCEVDLKGNDAGGESFSGHRVVTATPVTSTSYSCSVEVPYQWENQSYDSDTLTATATYTTIIYDSTQPLTVPGADSSSGTVVVLSEATKGLSVKYTTPVKLY